MSFLKRIQTCNQHDLNDFIPLSMKDGKRIGWIRKDNIDHLKKYQDVFEISTDQVMLISTNLNEEMARVSKELFQQGVIKHWRDEPYKVAQSFLGSAFFTIERCSVAFFGIRAFGVHLNGYVETDEGIKMWVARRSLDRAVAPGKLDNMVAGGQPANLGLMENVIKECAEEANVPESLASLAKPVGTISYTMQTDEGIKPDVMYCYDLKCPIDFVPQNTDGEASGFELMAIERVAEIVKTTEEFKFNCNLVVIDFLIRHGVLSPDETPDYEAIIKGLHS